MCGVAGIFYFDNNEGVVDRDHLDKLRDIPSMILRGPDGGDTWVSKNGKVGLAHRRLSIIDLSVKAKQPMTNEDENIVLSYNGEIYNHKQIRKELEDLNKYVWKTDHSDTEVILHAYQEWGIKCVDKLRGMFAFAIWDANVNQLFLVRDRLGIKPFYYTVLQECVIFSSDINAILEDKRVVREVDEKALFNYLSFLTSPAPDTLFKGIKKIENSTILSINLEGKITKTRYWDMFDDTLDLKRASEKEICELMVEEFKTSIRIHKESDVPTGVFLSGGIDSSLNAKLFSERKLLLILYRISIQMRMSLQKKCLIQLELNTL
jgi:asparagine synthase (glutamine-hydrolysing)